MTNEEAFARLATAYVESARAEHGTMMGFPCLRRNGAFFASHDPNSGALIGKLPATRVAALIESGTAEPFTPNGRTFREWAAVPPSIQSAWSALLDEAHAFAGTR